MVAIPKVFANGDDDVTAPPERDLAYPNMDSVLNQIVAQVEEQGFTSNDAADSVPVNSGDSVAVTIRLSGNVTQVAQWLQDNDGDPRHIGEDFIEAYVPVSLLPAVSQRPGIEVIDAIIPPQRDYGPITSQGVAAHLATAWHSSGYSGQGIKVGIMEFGDAGVGGGFVGIRNLRGSELPTTIIGRCYTDIDDYSSNLADYDTGGGCSRHSGCGGSY